MKKIGIITVLILIFAIGMLWSDTEERYDLNVVVSVVETLNHVKVWYIGDDNNNHGEEYYGTVLSGTPIVYNKPIWPGNAVPVTIRARGFRPNGEHVSVSKPADNWIYETIYLTIPELPYVDPTIPENE